MVQYYYPKMTKEKEESITRYLEKIARGGDTVPEDIEVDNDDIEINYCPKCGYKLSR